MHAASRNIWQQRCYGVCGDAGASEAPAPRSGLFEPRDVASGLDGRPAMERLVLLVNVVHAKKFRSSKGGLIDGVQNLALGNYGMTCAVV